MRAWDAYFHGQYLAARAYVFSKVFLCMVALDTWMLMIGHAGRYGVADFNVAHFALLDRLLPVPTPRLYVAVLLLTGLLALTLALRGAQRVTTSVLCLLYTYSWSMSMLDSYQHHYFVSLVLLCMVFFPRLSAHEVWLSPRTPGPGPASGPWQHVTRADLLYVMQGAALLGLYASLDVTRHSYLWFGGCAGTLAVSTWLHARNSHPRSSPLPLTQGFGFPLLTATVSVLYTFTAVAKMDAQWCDGYTLRRISSADQVFAPLLRWAEQLGIRAQSFWSLVATSVIPLELLIALGYVLAARQDAATHPAKRWLRRYVAGTFLLALSLHIGAEALRLDIGWFSYYMIALACTCLLPARAVQSLSRLITLPAQLIQRFLEEPVPQASARTAEAWFTCAAVSGVLAAAAYLIDLPGAPVACALAALGLVGHALYVVSRAQPAPAVEPSRDDAPTWAGDRAGAPDQRKARDRAAPRAGDKAGVRDERKARDLAHRDPAREVVHSALALGVAAVLMWTAIAVTDVRWDYYRYLGGDLQRRGEAREALAAYLKGERYAPEGRSRRTKIRQLQRELGLPVSP